MAPNTINASSSTSSNKGYKNTTTGRGGRGGARGGTNGYKNLGNHSALQTGITTTCYWCKTTFPTPEELFKHKPNCKETRPCTVCKQVFPSRAELIKHFHVSPKCNHSNPKFKYKDERRDSATASAPSIQINGNATLPKPNKGKKREQQNGKETSAFAFGDVNEALNEIGTASAMVRSSSEATSATTASAATAASDEKAKRSVKKNAKRKEKRRKAREEAATGEDSKEPVQPAGNALLSPELSTANRSPSPADSNASSTDEVQYVRRPSAQASPNNASSSTSATAPQSKFPCNDTINSNAVEAPANTGSTSGEPSIPASISSAAAPSRFQMPVTAFDFLTAQFNSTSQPASTPASIDVPKSSSKTASVSVTTQSSSITADSFSPSVSTSDSAPAPSSQSGPAIAVAPSQASASISAPAPAPAPASRSSTGFKKVISSPLSWGTNHAPPPPTLGSNAANSAQPSAENETSIDAAITKAAYGTSRDTILSYVAQMKQERREAIMAKRKEVEEERARQASASEQSDAENGSQVQQRDEYQLEPLEEDEEEPTIAGDSFVREDFEADDSIAEAAEQPEEMKEDQVIARDMAAQQSTSGWIPLPSPETTPISAAEPSNLTSSQGERSDSFSTLGQARQNHTQATTPAEIVADTLEETSAIQGTVPVDTDGNGVAVNNTATTGTEDDDDGTASEASATSMLVRYVVRDLNNDQGWESSSEFGEEPVTPVAVVRAQHRLQNAIYELNRRHMPSQEVIKQRKDMAEAVRRKLNGLLPEWSYNFQYQIATFGSTAYGLDTDNSDLDLCIMDPKRPEGFRNAADLYELGNTDETHEREPMTSTDDEAIARTVTINSIGNNSPAPLPPQVARQEGEAAPSPRAQRRREKKEAERLKKTPWMKQEKTALGLDAIYDVNRLAGVLRRMGFDKVTPIPSAGVPIVKFVSHEGIKADMNANEQLGVRNSALIASYVGLHPIVRPFLIFLKVWAKQRNLNDPSGARGSMSLSSYSLVLLAIAYMQRIGLVPNLQDPRWIKQAGLKRQAFWTKVPNRNAIKPGRHRGKFLGDYKAMVVETTFVKKLPKDADFVPSIPVSDVPEAIKPVSRTMRSNSSTGRRPSNARRGSQVENNGGIGWETEDDGQGQKRNGRANSQSNAASQSNKHLHLLELIEGFFRYYSEEFVLGREVVSVWAGQPLPRSMGYMPLAADEQGNILPQLPKITLEEREDLYDEEMEEEEEEIINSLRKGEEKGQVSTSASEAEAQEETENDEDEDADLKRAEEEERQANERLLELMREAGASASEIAEFEASLRARRCATPSPVPVLAGIKPEVAATTPISSSAHTGLDLPESAKVGKRKEYLFPFPAPESPSTFVEPPTWTQKLIVQDPFIHSRNTCLNIQPHVVDRILLEMRRARGMISSGARLEKVLLNVHKDDDPSYVLTDNAKGRDLMKKERAEATKARRKEKNRTRVNKYKEVRELKKQKNAEKAARRELKQREEEAGGGRPGPTITENSRGQRNDRNREKRASSSPVRQKKVEQQPE